jgi:hypothetical protein
MSRLKLDLKDICFPPKEESLDIFYHLMSFRDVKYRKKLSRLTS